MEAAAADAALSDATLDAAAASDEGSGFCEEGTEGTDDGDVDVCDELDDDDDGVDVAGGVDSVAKAGKDIIEHAKTDIKNKAVSLFTLLLIAIPP